MRHRIKDAFETTIPWVGSGVASDVGMIIQVRTMSYNTLISGFPNQKFISALDVNTIERYIMSMNPEKRSDTQAILENQVVMDALERADCQYKEGRAKPLRSLIRDLGFEVDALLD